MSSTSALTELCSSVCCCQTPALEPAACCDILLTKYDARESVLLQLSALRCIYNSCTQPITGSQHTVDTSTDAEFRKYSLNVASSLHLPCLYEILSVHLESCDRYICFCASKALITTLLYTGVKAPVITDIFTKVRTQPHTHVSVYCLQTVRELLKISRKRLHTVHISKRQFLQDSAECTQCISQNNHWLDTLELLLSESCLGASKLEPTVGEFFSLTVEILRCNHYSSATAPDSMLSQSIVTNLMRALSLVERCGNVYVLKRFVDVVLKTERATSLVDLVDFIAPALTRLLDLPVCERTLHFWMAEHGMKLLLDRPQTKKHIIYRGHEPTVRSQAKDSLYRGHELAGHGHNLGCISVRKTILLVMKCVASLLHNLSQLHLQPSADTEDALSRSHGVLKSIFTALCGLLASCEGLEGRSDLTVEQYTSALYQVMSEEDGCLVHLLQASTSILRQSIGGSSPIRSAITGMDLFLAITNPHTLWLCFLLSTNFDHSVLLDLMLSPEINFPTVLHDYLMLVVNDWKNFEKICSSCRQLVLRGSPTRQDRSTAERSWVGKDPVIKAQSEHGFSVPKQQTLQHQSVALLVDYSCSSSSEDQPESLSPELPDDDPTTSKLLAKASGFPISQEASMDISDSSLASSSSSSSSSSSPSPSLSPSPSSSPPSPSSESLLGRVMGCLIRLRMTLERLRDSGLLPPQTGNSDLITIIGNVEELYETLHA